MNDEELLFKQVQETTAASPETTVWVYRCSVYAYPWYTSVRTILDDPAYSPWFIKFKPVGPWKSPQCDNNYSPPLCRLEMCRSIDDSRVSSTYFYSCALPQFAATTIICRNRHQATLEETGTAPLLRVTAAHRPVDFIYGTIPQRLS